jgi:ABC-type sugar transport system, periplasmic component
MNKKIKIILWIIFSGLIILASFSLRPLKNFQDMDYSNVQDKNSDLIIVGFSQLGSESDWRTANTKSIQQALSKKNGFSLIYANGRQNQENQIKDVRSFIFQEVDYIVIAPATETGWDTVLEEAKQANIPVIIVDRMIDTNKENLYAAYVGTDKYAEGKKAGLWLEKYLKKQKSGKDTPQTNKPSPKETTARDSKSALEGVAVQKNGSASEGTTIQENGSASEKTAVQESKPSSGGITGQEKEQNSDTLNIVILEGTLNSTAQIGRSKGFEDIARNHKEWNILAQESGEFTKAKGKEIMEKYLQKFDNIDVLVSQNDDMTFGAIEAIQEAGLTCGVNGKIKIISFDAVSKAFDLMEEGLINVDIECNPLQGKLIATIIERLKKGEKVDKVSYMDGRVFEAENAVKERTGRVY